MSKSQITITVTPVPVTIISYSEHWAGKVSLLHWTEGNEKWGSDAAKEKSLEVIATYPVVSNFIWIYKLSSTNYVLQFFKAANIF